MIIRALFLILLLFTTIHLGSSRSIILRQNYNYTSTHHVSMDRNSQFVKATTVTCEPIYDFLPCTTTLWGLLFMIIVYEVLLSLGGQYVSSGTDLFFETFGTNIFGGSLFQMLGTIPQVVLVLVNGASGSSDSSTTDTMAGMSMGLLAGSTIMSLTLIWGSIVAFGSHDLSKPQNDSENAQTTKSFFSLTGFGVTTDVETSHTAKIMLVSMIPFLILQFAKILSSTSAIRVVILIALIVTVVFLFIYYIFQVFQPWIQNRRLEYLMLKYIQKNLLQNLLTAEGKPDEHAIKEVFHKIDQNGNAYISKAEMRALILGMEIDEIGLDEDDFVTKLMEEFDNTDDSQINETEFIAGISKWVIAARDSPNGSSLKNKKFFGSDSKKATEEQQSLLAKEKKTKKGSDKTWLNYLKAAFLLLLGTGITFALGQPLMLSIMEFSTAANIPSFMISYVVIPLALNFKQALRAITSAKKKTENTISLTLSEIYNGVFMNNMMGLAMFLALVYIQDMSWDVSAEVLVVLIICTIMGLYTSLSTKFPFWTGVVAYLMYPISILVVYVLTEVLGWS